MSWISNFISKINPGKIASDAGNVVAHNSSSVINFIGKGIAEINGMHIEGDIIPPLTGLDSFIDDKVGELYEKHASDKVTNMVNSFMHYGDESTTKQSNTDDVIDSSAQDEHGVHRARDNLPDEIADTMINEVSTNIEDELADSEQQGNTENSQSTKAYLDTENNTLDEETSQHEKMYEYHSGENADFDVEEDRSEELNGQDSEQIIKNTSLDSGEIFAYESILNEIDESLNLEIRQFSNEGGVSDEANEIDQIEEPNFETSAENFEPFEKEEKNSIQGGNDNLYLEQNENDKMSVSSGCDEDKDEDDDNDAL